MTRTTEFTDRAVGQHERSAFLKMRPCRAWGWSELYGTFLDRRLGLVEVQVQLTIDGRAAPWTNLTGIRRSDGQPFRRSWPRVWSNRTLSTLCRRFLEDLAA